jgi:4-amino-4-deoxy-L-arabinose transferase-like glycosyltransferase
MTLDSSQPSSSTSPLPGIRQRERLWSVVWVVGISAIAFFWGLASTGLVDETEPLFAEAARQMYETGDWITPYFNEVTRFDKPPLVYWLMAIGFHIFGVGEWAVRLPSALSGAALVGMGFYTLRRFGFARPELAIAYATSGNEQSPPQLARLSQRSLAWTAVIGAAVVALHPETIVWARTGVSDMLLSGCIGTTLLAFFMAYAQPEHPQRQRAWYLAAYGLMALAVLAKGPVGMVLPGLTVGVFLVYLGEWRVLWQEMQLVKGGLLFLALTVPWYVAVTVANGQAYIDSFFGYHNFERFTNVVNNHSAPWFFYFLVVAIGFLPWSPLLPWAMGRLKPWRRRYWQQQPRQARLGLFALAWFLSIFVFFTVAVTKLPSYVLPLMPAAGILIGLAFSDRLCPDPESPKAGWGWTVSAAANIGFFVVLAIAALYSPNWMGDDPAMPDLPERVRASGIMIWAGAIWGSAAVISIGLWIRRRLGWLWLVNLLAFTGFILFSILPAYQLADEIRQAPLRDIAATVVTEGQPGEPLYMVGFMKPSLVFYTEMTVTYVDKPEELPEALASETADSLLLVGTPEEITALAWPDNNQDRLLTTPTYELVRLNGIHSTKSG